MRIEKEFKELIPPLSDEELQELEKNCCEYGIRDHLVVAVYPGSDGEVLIDGHNRHEIARKCNLSFTTKRIDFESKEAAMIWMINNQIGRRNLSAYQRAVLALKTKPMLEKQARENQGSRTDLTSVRNLTNVDTKKELAKIAGVSHDTIHKVETIENDGDKELIDQVKRGEKTINRAYQEVRAKDTPPVESRSQREARELREAKQRHEEFEQTKSDKIVSLQDAIQDKEDLEDIADAFYEDFIKIGAKMLLVDNMIADGSMRETLRGMKRGEMSDLMNRARNYMGIMVRFQRILAEVADEK